MHTQPVITEEPIRPHQSPQKEERHSSQEQFFEMMDQVEHYDQLARDVRESHREAMFALAELKFRDSNALNVAGHRCLPAFLTVIEGQEGPQLKRGYVEYSQIIDQDDDDLYPDEIEEHFEIKKQCRLKDKQRCELNPGEKQQFDEKEILFRFGVGQYSQETLRIKSKFEALLHKLLQAAQVKEQLSAKYEGKA